MFILKYYFIYNRKSRNKRRGAIANANIVLAKAPQARSIYRGFSQ
jgi:hypothetical protein